jgi:hypothetical protein
MFHLHLKGKESPGEVAGLVIRLEVLASFRHQTFDPRRQYQERPGLWPLLVRLPVDSVESMRRGRRPTHA